MKEPSASSGRRSVFPGFTELSDRRSGLVGALSSTRRCLGLSQTEVAARMGTSQPAVARLESGESDARLSTIERYAAALGIALQWRLGGVAGDPPGSGKQHRG